MTSVISKTLPVHILKDNVVDIILSDYVTGDDKEYAYTIIYPNSVVNIINTDVSIINTDVLRIVGNYRNMNYTIVVTVNNKNFRGLENKFIQLIIPVEEDSIKPVIIKPFPDILMTSTIRYINLLTYFKDATTYSYKIYQDEAMTNQIYNYTNVSINGNNLVIVGGLYRNIVYYIRVTASNDKYSTTSVIRVLEDISPPVNIGIGIDALETFIGDNGNNYFKLQQGIYEYILQNYVSGTNLEFNIISNPKGNVSIVDSNKLRIEGNYRDEMYNVAMKATNTNTMGQEYTLIMNLNIIEFINPPVIIQELGSLTVLYNSTVILLENYFDYIKTVQMVVSIEGVVYEDHGVSLDPTSNKLTIIGDARSLTYDVVITVTNVSGTVISILVVTEDPPVPTLSQT